MNAKRLATLLFLILLSAGCAVKPRPDFAGIEAEYLAFTPKQKHALTLQVCGLETVLVQPVRHHFYTEHGPHVHYRHKGGWGVGYGTHHGNTTEYRPTISYHLQTSLKHLIEDKGLVKAVTAHHQKHPFDLQLEGAVHYSGASTGSATSKLLTFFTFTWFLGVPVLEEDPVATELRIYNSQAELLAQYHQEATAYRWQPWGGFSNQTLKASQTLALQGLVLQFAKDLDNGKFANLPPPQTQSVKPKDPKQP